jgi:hypothetical protein
MSKEYLTYEQGWDDAFDAIAKYVEAEVCVVTGLMIRRMKDEKWRDMAPTTSLPEPSPDLPSEAS